MKTLIIPDVHGRKFRREPVKEEFIIPNPSECSPIAIDYGFDEDSNYSYKFDVERRKHSFEIGMRVLLSVWGRPDEEQTCTITEVLEDGFIVQADGYVNVSEEYSIKKI